MASEQLQTQLTNLKATMLPLVTDIKAQLKAERTNLLNSMFNEGVLDGQFKVLLSLQDETCPNFVAEMISHFSEVSKSLISQIAGLLSEHVVNFEKVDGHLVQISGSSVSFGAKKVSLACTKFLQVFRESDQERSLEAFNELKSEFEDVDNKLQTMRQMERQIQVLETISTSINDLYIRLKF